MMKNTCWMPSEVRFEMPPELSYLGLLAAATSRVPAAICAGSGAGIRRSEPSNWSELKLPFPLEVLPTPLMLRTRREPSEATARPDGNHPAGSAPSTFHFLLSRETTAIALLPPQAT